jgi:sulfate adenylyltransferase subunit 1 (EFTu-like GTPase family)
MLEVKNKMRGPVQLVVRSTKAPRAFTTLIVPGIGKGNNIRLIEDELVTEYIERVEGMGLITTRYIPNSEIRKGD